MKSSNTLNDAIKRYKKIKSIGIRDLDFTKVPLIKLRSFARYVTTSWTPSILRILEIAMLVSFTYIYEIQTLDYVVNLLDMLTAPA